MAWKSRLPILVSEKEHHEQRSRITQREISRETGIRTATISEWMNWAVLRRLDADVVGRLATYLDCEPGDLFEWVWDETESSSEVAVAA